MATARKTPSTTRTGMIATPTARALFLAPDAGAALLYTPTGPLERLLLREALTPTLRLWAAALAGRRREPSTDEALYTAPGALRAFLCRDLCRERAGHPISRAMIAYCWYRVLRDDERRILAHYAETGRGVLSHPVPSTYDTPCVNATLF